MDSKVSLVPTAGGKPQALVEIGSYSLFNIWSRMLSRCAFPADPNYKHYGGRGISVCPRWLDFANFAADMGQRPDGLSLDRKDNNGPYSPDNCRWATALEQGRNTRRNRFTLIDGEPVMHTDAAKLYGVNEATIHRRMKSGRADRPLRLVHKLTDSQRLEILALAESSGLTRREIGGQYGITSQGVSHIVCAKVK